MTRRPSGSATLAGRWSALAALGCLSLGLCGCVSLLPKSAPVQLYRFAQPPPPPAGGPDTAALARAGHGVEVQLSEVKLPRAAAGDQILTATGDEAAYIAGARWLTPATLMFQEDVERAFDVQARRVRLLRRSEVGPAAALLRVEVGDFEALYDPPGSAPVILVSARASLTRPDGALLDARTFTVRQPAADNRVGRLVSAFDAATSALLTQLVAWTDDAAASP